MLENDVLAFSVLGRQLELGAQALGLGVLGLVRILPVILFGLVGGVLADMHDRRKLIIWTQVAAALFTALLAALTLSGNVTVLLLYLLTSAVSGVAAFETPAQHSLLPQLVPREHFTNAVSLNQLLSQFGSIVGPALAGVLLASFNVGFVYVLNTLSFVAVLIALFLMTSQAHPDAERAGVARPNLSVGAVVEGLRFVRGSQLIWGTMLLDFLATFFSSARTMLPIVAGDLLGVGAEGYGVLARAQAAGSLVAGLVLTAWGEIHKQGPVLLISVALYGLATALFGVSTLFALSYVLFALAGAADTVSTVIRKTLRQLVTPDHLRGRMVGVNMILLVRNSSLQMERPAPLLPRRLPIPLLA
ncbi:MAG: MFS transporter [Chloroflexota bacterium]|nr:MFS transporter [Chloroflexota bacterium]